jgi:hypothetical protein
MIYLTKQQLCAIYGPSSVSLERRFNADDSSVHDDTSAAYKYEFGYLQGRCIYAIVQKEQGGIIAPLESDMLLASNGNGQWKLREDNAPQTANVPVPKKPTPAPKPPDPPQKPPNNSIPLSFTYDPVNNDAFYPTHLFASHQMQRQQLVIFHPSWQVDLSQVESNPL